MSVKLSDLLPTPSGVTEEWSKTSNDPWFRGREGALVEAAKKPATSSAIAVREPPPYGRRKGYIPRTPLDFGDGGAFPEIHVAQFPLEMGRTVQRKGSNNTLALQVDAEGKVRYDAIARQGHSKEKVVYSRLADMKGHVINEEAESFQKPSEDVVAETTEKTRQALEKITESKVAAALPVRHAEKTGPAQYIRYTPSQQGAQYASGAQQRIIRMVEVQQDPMEPPKFSINQKIPKPPPSPPAPVMHSPSRKVTVKEQQEWKIPPCISNWKNPKGYTIPLDKRLAADGRGLQQVHINENFAKLAEALYIADRKAREAVDTRTKLEKRLATKKKEEQEEKMRLMAQKAREERAGIRRTAKDEDEEAKERQSLRQDRQNERRRERNIARAAPEKQAKLRRDKDRDISEKVALGLPDAKTRSDDTQFDQRLFNQSKGLDSGGGLDDETYAVYDKAWRSNETVSQHLYRPGKNLDKEVYGDDLDNLIKTNRFVPDKGFQGADYSASKRDGPVQFEKHEEDDPFGLGQLLQSAKEGKRRGDDSRDRGESSKRRKN